ncbi:MAG: alpha/beta fold hydrolase [Bacteriovoracaceae bacterium]
MELSKKEKKLAKETSMKESKLQAPSEKAFKAEYHTGRFPSVSGLGHIYYKTYIPKALDKEKPVRSIFLVHGLVEHQGRQMLLPRYLEEAGEGQIMFTWIDLIGHGLSGGPRAYIEKFRDFSLDVAHLINLIDGEYSPTHKMNHIIMGHSMGGLVTLKLMLQESASLKAKISGLILSNPCIRVKQEVPKIYLGAIHTVGGYLKKLRLPSIYGGDALTSDPKLAHDFDSDPLIPKFTTIGLLLQILEASKEIRSLAYYLNVPTLFLVAGQDLLVDNETTLLFARGVANDFVTIKSYPEMKHEMYNEVGRENVFQDVRTWLGKLTENH